MDTLTKDDIRRLLEYHNGLCMSIYLPTHRAGAATQKNPVRLKNLLRDAEERLRNEGFSSAEVEDFLRPARALERDRIFWQEQSDGLAVFVAAHLYHNYRLPLAFDERVTIASRFYIRPLLSLAGTDEHFYVLAISQNEVRLLRCTRFDVEDIELPNVPTSLASALQDDDPERQLQHHTGASASAGQGAIYHGHGTGSDEFEKENIRRYLRKVDEGLQEILRSERVPVVLAGVEYLHPLYKEANTYPHLIEGRITGNPEKLSPRALHAQAWPLVESHLDEERKAALHEYAELAASNLASTDPMEIVPAASHGRTKTLFVADGPEVWGVFNEDEHAVELHKKPGPDDEELLDLAAAHTLLKGGEVFIVAPNKMPDQAPLAAVFRY